MTTTFTKSLFADTYKDDFAEDANFHRVLFNSGKALQARELTQLQTIIQTEISRFGNNIFKDGAAVNPGGPSINKNYEFIKLDTTTNALPASSIVGLTFTGATVAIEAKVLEVVAATDTDPATLYVQYIDTSAGTAGASAIRMTAGQNITSGSHTLTVQSTNTIANPATGAGVKVSSGSGDFFVQGHFVFADAQSIIVSKYSNVYTGTVGFTITQDVVAATDDVTLYDNQSATPNLSSPGADRYRIQLTLVDQANVDAADDFIFFTKIINSEIVDQAKGTDNYNTINKLLADRTREESGNYIVKPFTLKYDADSAGASAKLVADVSSGLAYIDGYRTEVPHPSKISVNRSQTTRSVNNDVVGANYGNYIVVTDIQGLPNITTHEQWNLYDSAAIGGGVPKGTARIRSIAKDGANYKYYLSDVTMNSGYSFRNTKSIGIDSDQWGNLILENSKAVLKETANNDLLFALPNIRPQAITDIGLEVQRRFTGTTNGSGNLTVTLSATGETFASTNDWIVSVDSSGGILAPSFGAVGTQSLVINDASGSAISTAVEVLAKVNKSVGAIRTKTQALGSTIAVTAGIDSDGTLGVGSQKFLDLKKVDITNVQEIKDSANGLLDYTSIFTLDNGQRDNHYAPGRLILNGGLTAPTKVYAKFDHLTHGTAGDFFAVNSYTGQVDYENIPTHTLANGDVIRLQDYLDFRPTQDSDGSLGDGTSRMNELPSPAALITSDVVYYQGRKDKLVIFPPDEARLRPVLEVIEGVPSPEPQYPDTPASALELYRVNMSPYTINDSDLSLIRNEARRYTMADIGRIDDKVNSLSEVTSLSLLELDTNNLTILDSSGVNRLKSGFLVDNFANHTFSDTKSKDYRASINLLQKSLHPSFKEDNIRLIYDSDLSTNTVKKGDNVYINHTEITVLDQNKVSGTQNLNPFNVVTYNTEIVLSPSSDEWKDPIESVPVIDVGGDRTSAVDIKQDLNYNNTMVMWNGLSDGQLEELFDGANGIPDFAFDQGNQVSLSKIPGQTPSSAYTKIAKGESIAEEVNDRIINSTIVPFIRSRKIYFKTSGLVPNSTYFAFFDGVDVSSWVREEAYTQITDDATDYGNLYSTATAHPEGATALIADANGTISGSFFIPNTPAIRFRTGVREFALLDVSIYDKNAATSIATANYTSAGAIESKQGSIVNTKSLLQTPGYYDPIAQSFLVTEDKGYFVTKVKIYFKTKDDIVPVKVTLRPMLNGHPSSYNIIPGSIVWKNPSEITVIGTQTTAGVLAGGTEFVFDEPIFLNPKQEYAICVSAESSAYSVYVSEIRKFELGSTSKRITRQPSLGSLFLSQNGSTWEPNQLKDLTFKLTRADFDTAGGTVVMENASLGVDQLTTNPLDITSGDATVKVYQRGHGHAVNEHVTIGGLSPTGFYGGLLGANLNSSHVVTAVDYDHYTFEADSNATATVLSGADLVTASRKIMFDRATPYVENILPSGTSMSASGKFTAGSSLAGSETRFSKDTAGIPLTIKDHKIFAAPQMIAGDSDETAELGSGVNSLTISVPLTTSSTLVSPVVDMGRTSLNTVSHRIDKQASGATTGFNVPLTYVAETVAEGGSHIAKHITTPVALNEPAVGLKLLISANRPSVADFLVYYKIAEDGQILKDQPWVLVNKETEVTSDENVKVAREYRYLVGGDGGLEGINSFTEFQVKIVMRTTNSAKVPTIRNLRAVAMAV